MRGPAGVLLLAVACSRPNGAEPRDPPSSSPSSPQPPPTPAPPEADDRVAERESMVRTTMEARGVRAPAVLAAMRRVARHHFVLESQVDDAYADRPLPIVGGQTISQPYIVAFMTEAARPSPTSKCLEVGTGSGYQAAVLAEICKATFSIEYLPEVARFGEQNLRRAGYGPERVALRVGDGYAGWRERAPFDVILVTAAPEQVPPPLLEQLAVGGSLVIPVGERDGVQELERWKRVGPGSGAGAFEREALLGVRFVPFLGER